MSSDDFVDRLIGKLKDDGALGPPATAVWDRGRETLTLTYPRIAGSTRTIRFGVSRPAVSLLTDGRLDQDVLAVWGPDVGGDEGAARFVHVWFQEIVTTSTAQDLDLVLTDSGIRIVEFHGK